MYRSRDMEEGNEEGEKLYQEIIKPYNYLISETKGKGFRNKILRIFNEYYQVSDDKLKVIEESIDILHNSSLLIDDIEDEGEYRRGIKCAHKIFGIGQTINCGNLMYFKAWEKLMELDKGKFELNQIFVKSMIKLHIGQGKELYWRKNRVCPSEEEYLDMVVGKTGELFKLGVKILGCVSNNGDNGDNGDKSDKSDREKVNEKMLELCEILGIVYQIGNDLDLKDDLRMGNFSLPLIFCYRERGVAVQDVLDVADVVALGGVAHALEQLVAQQKRAERVAHCVAVRRGGADSASKVAACVAQVCTGVATGQ